MLGSIPLGRHRELHFSAFVHSRLVFVQTCKIQQSIILARKINQKAVNIRLNILFFFFFAGEL